MRLESETKLFQELQGNQTMKHIANTHIATPRIHSEAVQLTVHLTSLKFLVMSYTVGQLIQATPALKNDLEQMHSYIERNKSLMTEVSEAIALLKTRLSRVDKASIALADEGLAVRNSAKIAALSCDLEYRSVEKQRASIDAIHKASGAISSGTAIPSVNALLSIPSDFSNSICNHLEHRLAQASMQVSDLNRLGEFVTMHARTPQFINESVRSSAQSVLESLQSK